MKGIYTTTYEFAEICGEPGFAYEIRTGGRHVMQGWSRGSRKMAEAEVREAIRSREALRACAGLAS